ncbi:Selenoprotein O and cysteine-containing protein [Paenibacillus pasadenensis]|uniref:Protein nucleotidyltransferase YdiU n=1 Tax=Paenibacillus pasadenensis TaxID=217090 RepID=A0A2N5NCC5_9BACL|nr:YdiU family protein [Paenibacillus pasadenensis]PLT47991.1 Selenoprotein O and cysteine-containing protein [Paenibacillus pasadenensis]
MSEKKASAASSGWNLESSYARLPETLFTRQNPIPVRAPALAVLNRPLAAEMGLDPEALAGADGAETFAGNRLPDGAEPLAQAYAGHQFGYFNRLGDGRAVLLGEQRTPSGELRDIQLKGSGRTPYSRGGDGRAALGPMLREYIISEAMHGLGIPTTRSLAVVTTGERIVRETLETGAILTRVAASHLRVGTFQFAAQWGSEDELRQLADYALRRHDPQGWSEAEAAGADGSGRALRLLQGTVLRQASLLASWQLVGFVHGVMNTDNMTISGETIDYGPCAFLDRFDPATVFSSIDSQGRYAYGNQPYIAAWNLARLAESLLPLLHEDQEQALELAEGALAAFEGAYHGRWLEGMRGKLGLLGEEEGDEELVSGLLRLMQEQGADYTNAFRALTLGQTAEAGLCGEAYEDWLRSWSGRRARHGEAAASESLMRRSNPSVIPRNHRVEEALAAAETGDFGVMERLLAALADPYAYSAEQEEYAAPAPEGGLPYRTFCGT